MENSPEDPALILDFEKRWVALLASKFGKRLAHIFWMQIATLTLLPSIIVLLVIHINS